MRHTLRCFDQHDLEIAHMTFSSTVTLAQLRGLSDGLYALWSDLFRVVLEMDGRPGTIAWLRPVPAAASTMSAA